MKFRIFFMLLVSILILNSCGPGFPDAMSEEKLSGGYRYHFNEVGFPVIFKDSKKYKSIPAWIIDYNFNDDFIIVTNKDCSVCDEITTNMNINPSAVVNDCYKLIEKVDLSFWIIFHKNDSIYGPFSKKEYLKYRKELGVPDELIL